MKTANLDKYLDHGDHCLVLRPFRGERKFTKGEVVNVSEWRTTEQLVEDRFLRRLPKAFNPDAKSPGRPRKNAQVEVDDGLDA